MPGIAVCLCGGRGLGYGVTGSRQVQLGQSLKRTPLRSFLFFFLPCFTTHYLKNNKRKKNNHRFSTIQSQNAYSDMLKKRVCVLYE